MASAHATILVTFPMLIQEPSIYAVFFGTEAESFD